MRDLEIRGAGNLLGAQQSGHIAAVGYDLYCRLLADAVRAARGERKPERTPASLMIDLPGGIPDEYVPDLREKFRLFRRVATTTTVAELDDLVEETRDRFGAPPAEVERLLLAQRTRLVAGGAGVARVLPAEVPGVVLDTGDQPGGIQRLARRLRLRVLSDTTGLLPVPGARTAEAALRETVRRLEELDAGRAPGSAGPRGADTLPR
jgi:transcription-repair coupling factor (superfamily II helicase)